MTVIAGKRVLVVEDEALVAAMVEDMLADLGAVVVGIAPTIERALAMCDSAEIDVAVLDVNLRGQRIDPVAKVLEARGVPFVFATGYGAALAKTAAAPVLDKPYTREKLAAALMAALGGAVVAEDRIGQRPPKPSTETKGGEEG